VTRRPGTRRASCTGRAPGTGCQGGQAALEVVALLPLLVALALLAVQVASVLGAASQAQDRARAKAMQADGPPGSLVAVEGSARPPALTVLAARGGAIHVRAAVRVP